MTTSPDSGTHTDSKQLTEKVLAPNEEQPPGSAPAIYLPPKMDTMGGEKACRSDGANDVSEVTDYESHGLDRWRRNSLIDDIPTEPGPGDDAAVETKLGQRRGPAHGDTVIGGRTDQCAIQYHIRDIDWRKGMVVSEETNAYSKSSKW